MIKYLSGLIAENKTAWDCGCGNGQVAVILSDYFKEVYATDISAKQIENAVEKPNVQYRITTAENSGLENNSVDMITVAQAIHWFDFNNFYAEVNRVSKTGCILAVWCYSLVQINAEADALIGNLYSTILGDKYWDAERNILMNNTGIFLSRLKRLYVRNYKL